VLIYKASGVFNFAQGAMVSFAALTCVGMVDKFGFSVAGRAAHRGRDDHPRHGHRTGGAAPLVNQPEITLFMATIGLAFFIEGLAQLVWGNRYAGTADRRRAIEYLMDKFNILVSQFDIMAAGVCALLVTSLALLFSQTKGAARCARVADDHQAALAVGIPLQRIWAVLWAVAGLVALVAGMLWGARNGVQFALTFVALKALPVLILGGFTSMPGAIVGGLIIGAPKKWPRCISARWSAAASRAGSRTCWPCCSCWCGRKACSAKKSSAESDRNKDTPMLYREAGQFKPAIRPTARSSILQDRIALLCCWWWPSWWCRSWPPPIRCPRS
jgi:branched-chain amino acid transport system permease protein